MKRIKISKKWFSLMIGLCVFSLTAAVVEYQKVKPEGWLIESSDVQSGDLLTADSTVQSNPGAGRAIDPTLTGPSIKPATGQTADSIDLIPVYLVGAVSQPGIYQVVRGSYLYELIDQAGGLSEDAAATEINLAQKITDNVHIRIPTTAEYTEHPGFTWTADAAASASKSVNLNTASIDELDALPGIGPATAKAIVDFRERNGPYTAKEDLMRVAGIKQSRYDAIADLIDIR
jgi:comEA protein